MLASIFAKAVPHVPIPSIPIFFMQLLSHVKEIDKTKKYFKIFLFSQNINILYRHCHLTFKSFYQKIRITPLIYL